MLAAKPQAKGDRIAVGPETVSPPRETGRCGPSHWILGANAIDRLAATHPAMHSTPIPNNLGPTLLLVMALLLLPLGIGVPLLLISLAQVRTWQGQPAYPRLHAAFVRLRAIRPRRTRLIQARWSGRKTNSGLVPEHR